MEAERSRKRRAQKNPIYLAKERQRKKNSRQVKQKKRKLYISLIPTNYILYFLKLTFKKIPFHQTYTKGLQNQGGRQKFEIGVAGIKTEGQKIRRPNGQMTGWSDGWMTGWSDDRMVG